MGMRCPHIATLFSADYGPFHAIICAHNEGINAWTYRSPMACIIITVHCVGKYRICKEVCRYLSIAVDSLMRASAISASKIVYVDH